MTGLATFLAPSWGSGTIESATCEGDKLGQVGIGRKLRGMSSVGWPAVLW